ncbi:MAG: triose-phosphate isomerase [Pseudomonadota bacterium]
MARKLAAGNWKMNGLKAALDEVCALLENPKPDCDVLICPAATLLSPMSDLTVGTFIQTGAQDCHSAKSGAHTGDVSADMIADAGGSHVIVGHSERRTDHGETDSLVKAKAEAGLDAGLIPVVCVGETEAERDAGKTLSVVETQLKGSLPDTDGLVVAYEPVWAIGTGRTPTLEQIAEVHTAIRAHLKSALGDAGDEVSILYGGSVKPGNAAEIFAVEDVDGALVGGASLKASDFGAIIDALATS